MEDKWGPSMYGPAFDNAIWAIVDKINRGEYDHKLDDLNEMYPSYFPGSGPIHKAINDRKATLRD